MDDDDEPATSRAALFGHAQRQRAPGQQDNDFVMQAITWHACDVDDTVGDDDDDDDGDGDGDDGGDAARRTKKYFIKAFGCLADGRAAALTITGFTPYFYAKLERGLTQVQVGSVVRHLKLKALWGCDVVDVRCLQKKDFWGFTNGELQAFLRVSCNTLRGMRGAADRLGKQPLLEVSGLQRPTRVTLYESNIDPLLRFFHVRDLQPAGWLRVPRGRHRAGGGPAAMEARCDIDLCCRWQDCFLEARDEIAPLLVASFDIECSSSHGDFPVAKKDYRKVAQDLYAFFQSPAFGARAKGEFAAKELLIDAMLAPFADHLPAEALAARGAAPREIAESGAMARAYLKRNLSPQDAKNLVSKVKRLVDDVYVCLRGRAPGGPGGLRGLSGLSASGALSSASGPALTGGGAISALADALNGALLRPFPLQGDQVIQIGTTVHKYGSRDVVLRAVVTLGSCDAIDGCTVVPCETEEELLSRWASLVSALDPDVVTGWNIFGFDFEYVHDRAEEAGCVDHVCRMLSRLRNVERPRMMGGKPGSWLREQRLSSSALGDNVMRYVDMHGRVTIDLMKVIQRDHKLDSYKLDLVAQHFLGQRKNDVSPAEIFRLQRGSSADRRVIAEYCVQDCALCNHLTVKLEIVANNVGMANVCSVPLSFIFMRGQGVKIFSLVAKQCKVDGFLVPVVRMAAARPGGCEEDAAEEGGYEGAIVLDPTPGMYLEDPVAVLDYASLYPSSMISENLSHDCFVMDERYDNLPGVEYLTVSYEEGARRVDCRFAQIEGKGVLPRILMALLKQRKATRKRMESVLVRTAGSDSAEELQGFYDAATGAFTDLGGAKRELPPGLEARDAYSEFQKAVMDGLQLAYKVTANSLYGQMGARTSPLYLKQIAACTTATGRKMILMAKAFLEENYCAQVVYGDSVAGYTPVFTRWHGRVFIDTVEGLARRAGEAWLPCLEPGKQDKEALELMDGVEVWSDAGWTPAHRLIRHRLAPHKRMLRVTTHTGVVDVTDDHSLLRPDGHTVVKPNELVVGERVLHTDLPAFGPDASEEAFTEEQARVMGFFMGDGSCGVYATKHGTKASWALNNNNMDRQLFYKNLCESAYPELNWKIMDTLESSNVYTLVPNSSEYGSIARFVAAYRSLMYDCQRKIVPRAILCAPEAVRRAFWQGLYDADGDKDANNYNRLDQQSQLSAATIFALASSLGYNVSVDTRADKPDIFRLTMTSSSQRKQNDVVKKITEIDGFEGFVYDFTTDNHHFAAGVGRIVVHNTDSIFIAFPKGKPLGPSGVVISERGHAAIMPSIRLAMQASAEFKARLKPPHDLEYEKTFWPWLIFSKKRYVGNVYEFDDVKCKQKSMGIVLKRRDNAPIVKRVYGGCINIILKDQDVQASLSFLQTSLSELVEGRTPLEELVVSKTLKAEYKNPDQIAHHVLAQRIGEREPGNKPQVNDRIPYVYVENPPPAKGQRLLQGDRIEHPDFVRRSGGKVRPDYRFYITNQIMKPVQQLFALALESIPGYRKAADHWKRERARLVGEYDGDAEKADDKVQAQRENDVKALLFDPVLRVIDNRANHMPEITKWFTKKN